jgi:hypothetical protein
MVSKDSESPSAVERLAVDSTVDPTEDAGGRRPLPTASIGRIVAGRYGVQRRLGQGGFGVVYEARDALTGRNVAVKLLQAQPGRDEARFRDEVTMLRYLRLPGVVELIDEGVDDDGTGFIVMPVLDASPFPGRIFAGTWESIRDTVFGLLETLAYVHAANVVHRDIKPSNVLVDADGRAQLLDFGASWQHDWFLTRSPGFGASLAGTPMYFAPEQLIGKPGDARSDLYAVGIMLYEALTGTPPHPADDLGVLLRARMAPLATPVTELNPYVPDHVSIAVTRMLAPTTGQRFQTALDVLDALGASRPDDLLEQRVRALAHGNELDDDALRQLIAGPEKVFHLQSDGMAAMRAWAGRDARRAAAHARGWLRAGLATFENGKLRITRGALERMQSLPPVQVDYTAGDDSGLSELLLELHAWIDVAWPTSDLSTLARVTGRSTAQLKRELAELRERALIVELPDGRWQIRGGSPANTAWEPHRQRAAHRAIADALVPGTAGRLTHEFQTTDPARILAEVRAVAVQRSDEGRLDDARAALSEGLRTVRNRLRDAKLEYPLLRELALVAFRDVTRVGYDHALYELGRAIERTPEVQRLEKLVEAARLAEAADVSRAFELLDAVGAYGDSELESWRRSARARAANVLPLEEHAAIVRSLAKDPGLSDRDGMARISGWWSRIYYREGQYDRSAEAALAAGHNYTDVWMRLATISSGASALMESSTPGALERASATARALIEQASELRLPQIEARAWWIHRGAEYRLGRISEPDMDLVAAYLLLDAPGHAGAALFTEAALAWRAGDRLLARELSEKTHQLADRAGFGVLRGFACCLEAVVSDTPDTLRDTRATAFVRDERAPLATRVQGAALLARATVVKPEALWPGGALRWNRGEVSRLWNGDARREVLTLAECAEALEG